MSMAYQSSLLEPSGASSLAAAGDWLTGTLLGSLAVALCVIAVAIVGLLLLTGRVAVREGARVIVGCFLLLGAPIVAASFFAMAQPEHAAPPVATVSNSPVLPERADLPPAQYDPYAGASVRDDR